MWVSFGVVNVSLKLEWSRFLRHASATFPPDFLDGFHTPLAPLPRIYLQFLVSIYYVKVHRQRGQR